MPQYNMHKELNEFYNNHVRLKDEIKQLRKLRDTNLTRLKEGLVALNKPAYVKAMEQGSIAMHTANKALNNDYDIDLAVIFEKDDLPASPLDARKRVASAIAEKASGFSREPEARTNAVTVWYADGYHVDIAVYRRSEDFWGNETLEHASSVWSVRDPKAITDWFINEVKTKSPSESFWSTPEVDIRQMRRIVRWIKSFTKSREGWNLPGGLVISALVAECYHPHNERDDLALYNTLTSIKSRLDLSCTILNPVDASKELTEKQKFLTQVKNLKKRLGSVITKLNKLFCDDCTRVQALKSWNYMFQNDYWNPDIIIEKSHTNIDQSVLTVDFKMGIARTRGGKLTADNIVPDRFLPKKIHLKFLARTNVPQPYTVKWRVKNSGDEAEAANEIEHTSSSTSLTNWESTAYRGKHEMICEIISQGQVIASSTKSVNVR